MEKEIQTSNNHNPIPAHILVLILIETLICLTALRLFIDFKILSIDPIFTWSYTIALTLPILAFMYKHKVHFSHIGFNKKNLYYTAAFSLIFGMLFLFVFVIIHYKTNQNNIIEKFYDEIKYYEKNFGNPTLFSILYLFHCTLQELFRSFFQCVLQRHIFKNPNNLYPIFYSSLTYGFAHIFTGFLAVLLTTILGFILGVIYQRQKNIYGVIFIHYLIGIFAWLFGYLR